MSNKVIAVAIADIHMSHNPPAARSVEPDWYVAMDRMLDQVRSLQDKYKCPVLCAGDIFHKHDSCPELVNWAITHLPRRMVAVPGQHDLPMHVLEDVKKSSYWTLVEANVIRDISKELCRSDDVVIRGFPFGEQVYWQETVSYLDHIRIALVHSYVWIEGCSYETASRQDHLVGWKRRLGGYGIAIFGDNHLPFDAKSGDCQVYNCGCLIRRRSDERSLRPAVGLIHDDGTITRHYLDVQDDKWIDTEPEQKIVTGSPNMDEFVDELKQLQVDRLDFADAVMRYTGNPDNKVEDGTRQVLIEALEQK
jgi:predicted phosphodiesterase